MFAHPPRPVRLFPPLLHRPPSAAQVRQSLQLFRYGFLCLPFLWLLNYSMYRQLLVFDDTPPEMKAAVRWSVIAFAIVMTAAIVSLQSLRTACVTLAEC